MGQYHDTKLTQQIAEGDPHAFKQIYERYAPAMFNNAFRFTKHHERAKDLTQDIFFRIWTNREKLLEVENFEAYLYVVARNCIFNDLKKQLPLNGSGEFVESFLLYDDTTPLEQAETRDLEKRLMESIAGLPAQMQTVFRLSRFEGLTHAQIAAKLGISENTSKSYVVRALIAIRRQLSGQGEQLIVLLLALWKLR